MAHISVCSYTDQMTSTLAQPTYSKSFQSRIYTVAFIYMHLDLDSIQVAGLDERNTQIRKPTASRPWCHSPGIIMHEDVCTCQSAGKGSSFKTWVGASSIKSPYRASQTGL
ncbi:hypothetical protein NW765_001964 [Fusarium oxysporum]|nr:hypothetical protein NW765_001964 [Fusarium oxysporum]